MQISECCKCECENFKRFTFLLVLYCNNNQKVCFFLIDEILFFAQNKKTYTLKMNFDILRRIDSSTSKIFAKLHINITSISQLLLTILAITILLSFHKIILK